MGSTDVGTELLLYQRRTLYCFLLCRPGRHSSLCRLRFAKVCSKLLLLIRFPRQRITFATFKNRRSDRPAVRKLRSWTKIAFDKDCFRFFTAQARLPGS